MKQKISSCHFNNKKKIYIYILCFQGIILSILFLGNVSVDLIATPVEEGHPNKASKDSENWR